MSIVAVESLSPDAEASAAHPPRGVDRRTRPTPFLSRYALYGGRRRSAGRRASDGREVFVDLHGAGLWTVVLAIVALNILDAWFTVFFLSHGGQELNPIIESILHLGTWPFIALKSVGIGLCVAVLTIAKNFRYARLGLGCVLVGYSALLGWHFWLWSTAV